LLPGYKATVTVPGGKLDGVLVVPLTAVAKNRVWLHTADGKDEATDVVVGRSDGSNVQINRRERRGLDSQTGEEMSRPMRFRIGHFLCLILLAPLIGCAHHVTDPAHPSAGSTRYRCGRGPSIARSKDGVAYSRTSQNVDGSWGTGTASNGNEVVASVPGSHQAFSRGRHRAERDGAASGG